MICKCGGTDFEVKETPEGGVAICTACSYPNMIEQVSLNDLFRYNQTVSQLRYSQGVYK